MCKVKLPREVAEAVTNLLKQHEPSYILWRSSRPEADDDGGDWGVIYDFASTRGNNFKLADALRYGYEIKLEPITVMLDPEKIEQIRAEYYRADPAAHGLEEGWQMGFLAALDLVGIKIPTVNE